MSTESAPGKAQTLIVGDVVELTKRELFAVLILQGYAANHGRSFRTEATADAVRAADDLIAALAEAKP